MPIANSSKDSGEAVMKPRAPREFAKSAMNSESRGSQLRRPAHQAGACVFLIGERILARRARFQRRWTESFIEPDASLCGRTFSQPGHTRLGLLVDWYIGIGLLPSDQELRSTCGPRLRHPRHAVRLCWISRHPLWIPGRSNNWSAAVNACVRISSVLTREVRPEAAKIMARTTN